MRRDRRRKRTALGLGVSAAVGALLLTPATGSAHPPPPPSSPCAPEVAACVQLSTEYAWLQKRGHGPVQVRVGMPGHETPVGTSAVDFKDIDHTSSLYENAPMPYSVFFNGGIAFHQGDLDYQSHGCIRMSAQDAATFYNELAVGDLVQVVN